MWQASSYTLHTAEELLSADTVDSALLSPLVWFSGGFGHPWKGCKGPLSVTVSRVVSASVRSPVVRAAFVL